MSGNCSYERSGRRSPRSAPRWPSVKAVIVRQVRKPTVKTKGPGARDGERSFGRHPSNSFTTPDTKRTKGQGPGMVNVLLAATPTATRSRPCGLKGQGQGMVNVLLAARPATRSRPQAIKGQEPGLVDVLLAATHSNSFTTSALRRERVCSVVNLSSSPTSAYGLISSRVLDSGSLGPHSTYSR